jgi:hypothetical protein
MTATPRSFTEVAGWREAFRDAAQRLDEVRTGSLFPEVPTLLCGEPVRPLTLRDWTLLDQADSPLVAGGEVGLGHCTTLIWLLSPRYLPGCGARARMRRALLVGRVYRANRYDEGAVIKQVLRFVDDAFLDLPGRFSKGKPGGGISPTQWPRKAQEIELCGEIMRAYPSFTYAELRAMPLAQFWQWLHDARASTVEQIRIHAPGAIDSYRNYQLTDEVNAQACDTLNRLRREAASVSGTN